MLKGRECARGFAGHVGAARAPQWQGGRRPFSATGTRGGGQHGGSALARLGHGGPAVAQSVTSRRMSDSGGDADTEGAPRRVLLNCRCSVAMARFFVNAAARKPARAVAQVRGFRGTRGRQRVRPPRGPAVLLPGTPRSQGNAAEGRSTRRSGGEGRGDWRAARAEGRRPRTGGGRGASADREAGLGTAGLRGASGPRGPCSVRATGVPPGAALAAQTPTHTDLHGEGRAACPSHVQVTRLPRTGRCGDSFCGLHRKLFFNEDL